MTPRAWFLFLVLGIPPFLVILAGVILLFHMYPIHVNSNIGWGQDPAYQYLFAGLDILQGNSPAHTDHPGTPLQTLIAAVITIVWFCMRSLGVTELGLFQTVLHKPEVFLMFTSGLLLALTGVALYYFGQRIYRSTQSLATSIACQLTPLLYVLVVPNLVFPTPEALLICISVALMGVLTPVLLDHTTLSTSSLKAAANWAGLLCGLGVATKLTFMPMLGLLLLFRATPLIFRSVCCCLVAWFIGVLPILPRLGGMFRWFYSLLTHSGIHGSGKEAIFDFEQAANALTWLISHFSLFYFLVSSTFFLLFIGLILLGVRWLLQGVSKYSLFNSVKVTASVHSVRPEELVIAGVLFTVLSLQTVMVVKHLGPSYMIPALPLPMLAAAWLLHRQQIVCVSGQTKKILIVLWLSLVVLVAVTSTYSAIQDLNLKNQAGRKSQNVIKQELRQFDNPIVFGTFNCNFVECALWFGGSLVPGMGLKMAEVTPNFYYYDIFSKKLHKPGVGELSDLQANQTIVELTDQTRPILLISPPFPHLSKLKLELIVSTPVQNLYHVRGVDR